MKLSFPIIGLTFAVSAGPHIWAVQGFSPSFSGRYPSASSSSSYTPTLKGRPSTNVGLGNIAVPLESNMSDIIPVNFPPPLTKVDRLKRAAEFWLSTAPIVTDYFGQLGTMKLQELHGMKFSEDNLQQTWDAHHEKGAAKLAATISDMKGFYVKAAQIIATRGDLFPEQYTEKLKQFSDNLDPMPTSLAKAVIIEDLLKDGEQFEDVFAEFDEQPLGAASIAQVHRAVLTEKYGGREVAVKIQRPSIESKLMGDIANLKMIAKLFQGTDISPVDYYTIFSELEIQLADEFDFLEEAKAMDSISKSLETSFDGSYKTDIPIVIPKSIPGLVSSRVLVMDFLQGTSLLKAQDKMLKAGIQPGSPPAKLFGKKLVQDLTHVVGRNILETGLFHADMHPGNIYILEDGAIGLIDFGQVKQLSPDYRETIAKIVIALDERDSRPVLDLEAELGSLLLELGVEFKDDAKPQAAAAVAMWLFDGSVEQLPGGYDVGELSPNSPIRDIKVFPQELVLVARSSILIKALANRFNIRWSLAKQWAPIAREVLYGSNASSSAVGTNTANHSLTWRSRVVAARVWNKVKRGGRRRVSRVLKRMPLKIQSRIAAFLV